MIVLISFLLESFVDVQVKGWLKLTPEQRERCIMKLRYGYTRLASARPHRLVMLTTQRDLVRQRDEMVQSNAVNANDLEDRLK